MLARQAHIVMHTVAVCTLIAAALLWIASLPHGAIALTFGLVVFTLALFTGGYRRQVFWCVDCEQDQPVEHFPDADDSATCTDCLLKKLHEYESA